jgi:pimeloyl-ACP methyl ester carboxylesterase
MHVWLLLLAVMQVVVAQPCTTGTAACTEKLPMGPKDRFVTIYRSHSLAQPNTLFKRALVVIHGAGRNADDYFASGMGGAFLAGALNDTLVVAPRFAAAKDTLEPGEILFHANGDDWRGGGPGVDVPEVTTYHVIDELIRRFADKKQYPNLKQVVLMGHSAGGQFLSRYAARGLDTVCGLQPLKLSVPRCVASRSYGRLREVQRVEVRHGEAHGLCRRDER